MDRRCCLGMKFNNILFKSNLWKYSSTKGHLLVRLWEVLIGQTSHIDLDQLTGLELGIEGLDGLLQALHRPQQGRRKELVGPMAT